MPYEVEVRDVAAQTIAAIRCEAQLSQLSEVVPRLCGEVWEYAKAAGLTRPNHLVALYRDGCCVEVGVEVGAPFAGDERVVCSHLPGGKVATVAYLGPYERLCEPHTAIQRWCGEHGLALAGSCWEIYGHAEDDPAKQRTDVFYLLGAG